ncbi:MAG: TlpA family protein disulfide reductase [Acidobacteria bacterium]|nr:TlpA family protein disulfide reductase [Acidobacteriota bacterium]
MIVFLWIAACAAAAAEVPRRAPEFAFQLNDGKQILLSQYRGKVVVLEMLYTTCPHCQHSAQMLGRLAKEYGPRGFQPLGVAFNDMASMLVPEFIKQSQANFPIGFSPRDPVLAFLEHPTMLRFVVPQMVLVDRKGMVRGQTKAEGDDAFYEEKSLRQKIEALLTEPAAGARKAAPKKKAS